MVVCEVPCKNAEERNKISKLIFIKVILVCLKNERCHFLLLMVAGEKNHQQKIYFLESLKV